MRLGPGLRVTQRKMELGQEGRAEVADTEKPQDISRDIS